MPTLALRMHLALTRRPFIMRFRRLPSGVTENLLIKTLAKPVWVVDLLEDRAHDVQGVILVGGMRARSDKRDSIWFTRRSIWSIQPSMSEILCCIVKERACEKLRKRLFIESAIGQDCLEAD